MPLSIMEACTTADKVARELYNLYEYVLERDLLPGHTLKNIREGRNRLCDMLDDIKNNPDLWESETVRRRVNVAYDYSRRLAVHLLDFS